MIHSVSKSIERVTATAKLMSEFGDKDDAAASAVLLASEARMRAAIEGRYIEIRFRFGEGVDYRHCQICHGEWDLGQPSAHKSECLLADSIDLPPQGEAS